MPENTPLNGHTGIFLSGGCRMENGKRVWTIALRLSNGASIVVTGSPSESAVDVLKRALTIGKVTDSDLVLLNPAESADAAASTAALAIDLAAAKVAA